MGHLAVGEAVLQVCLEEATQGGMVLMQRSAVSRLWQHLLLNSRWTVPCTAFKLYFGNLMGHWKNDRSRTQFHYISPQLKMERNEMPLHFMKRSIKTFTCNKHATSFTGNSLAFFDVSTGTIVSSSQWGRSSASWKKSVAFLTFINQDQHIGPQFPG